MEPNNIEFCVYGALGLFTDPYSRIGGEKTTYQIPTYQAIKEICKSIYWKPTFIWVVDEIRVMNPIITETHGVRPIKLNSMQPDIANYTYLFDCKYQVRAHIEWNINRPEYANDRSYEKHLEIAKRCIKKGGRRDVFLGTRDCQAHVVPCIFGEGDGAYDNVDIMGFGLMYHGLTYPDEAYSEETQGYLTVNMWSPIMRNGVIKFLRPEECPHHKKTKEMEIKKFNTTKSDGESK